MKLKLCEKWHFNKYQYFSNRGYPFFFKRKKMPHPKVCLYFIYDTLALN